MSSCIEQKAFIDKIESKFKISQNQSLAPYVNYSSMNDQPIHRWFNYREGYAPQLVDFSIKRFVGKINLLLDPFCGSGTSLVVATSNGIPSVGFDINPISVLISKIKTRIYDCAKISIIWKYINIISDFDSTWEMAEKPKLSIIDKVFNEDILSALLIWKKVIFNEKDSYVRDFLVGGWLSIMESVSNTFKEGNGIKYRNRKRTPNGYITLSDDLLPFHNINGYELVKKSLKVKYEIMLEDVNKPANIEAKVFEQSSNDLHHFLDKDIVSLSVFSPPYCNNFNYVKIYKVELWMGDFVKDYDDVRSLNKKALRSHVEIPINLPKTIDLPNEIIVVSDWIKEKKLWNNKIPIAVLAYFIDMKMALSNIYKVTEYGGECHIVVGNSAYGGVLVPTDIFLASIAEEIGFHVKEIIVVRHLTTSSQQRIALMDLKDYLRESIIVLQK